MENSVGRPKPKNAGRRLIVFGSIVAGLIGYSIWSPSDRTRSLPVGRSEFRGDVNSPGPSHPAHASPRAQPEPGPDANLGSEGVVHPEAVQRGVADVRRSLLKTIASEELRKEVEVLRAVSEQPVLAAAVPSRPAEDPDRSLFRRQLELVKRGRDAFARISGYTATLTKRERIGSSLTEGESIRVKIRHSPFSVYMQWASGDPGKELLYVEGTNEDRMLVHLGGLKGRLFPAININPFGSLASAESRYPVTKTGILALTDLVIENRERELRGEVFIRGRCEGSVSNEGRPCQKFVFEFVDAQQSPLYRKSIQYVDQEWNVPICVENYAWPDAGRSDGGSTLDEATLIEYYSYSEIEANVQLTNGDFDRSNSEYRFRR